MNNRSFIVYKSICLLISVLMIYNSQVSAGSLPSWNEGPAKKAIMHFVQEVTNESGANYVPPMQRIATFDNDGTLWTEYPMYTQAFFAADRVRILSEKHPEWKTKQSYKSLIAKDFNKAMSSEKNEILEYIFASQTGLSATEFTKIAGNWLRNTKHHKFNIPYVQAVYQPQLELLAYLRENGFKTFIVSGGGMDFIRSVSEQAYGIPPEQVIGSTFASKFQIINGKPDLMRSAKIAFIDDKSDKPVGIYQHIGRRPILAFGNSDNDRQMIEYTMGGDGLRLGLFVHHTDAEREYSYDRNSPVGSLDKVLDMAKDKQWIIVDMKKDWKTVFQLKE